MCKILGALGVDMQVANLDGNGPIHIAAEAGHAEAVRVFIDKGISPDTPGAGGQVVSPRGVV
jgi:ankyrin repeat protein